jgi:AbrB family looped-hinge helix DNA binding protein
MSTMTTKGQVTIPKHILDELGIHPGDEIDFKVNYNSELVLKAFKPADPTKIYDRFEEARGTATIKWKTDELMQLLRGDD